MKVRKNGRTQVGDSGPVVVLSPDGKFCNEQNVTMANVQEMIDRGLLKAADREETFVIYSQTSNGHTQTGLCAVVSVNDYQRGVIKRHEKIITEKRIPGSPKPPLKKVVILIDAFALPKPFVSLLFISGIQYGSSDDHVQGE